MIITLILWALMTAPWLWHLRNRPIASWTINDLLVAVLVLAVTLWAVEFERQNRREYTA